MAAIGAIKTISFAYSTTNIAILYFTVYNLPMSPRDIANKYCDNSNNKPCLTPEHDNNASASIRISFSEQPTTKDLPWFPLADFYPLRYTA